MAETDNPLLQGMATGAELANKAVDIERRQQEIQQKRQEIELHQVNYITDAARSVIATKKGPMRKIAINKFEETVKAFGKPYDPAFSAYLEDDGNHIDLAENLTSLYGLPKEYASEALNNIIGLTSDGINAATKVAESAGKIRVDREKILADSKKGTNDPQKILELTQSSAKEIQSKHAVEYQAIAAATTLNDLAASSDSRDNQQVQNAAQTMLAKVLDPATGVREPEYLRVTGLTKSAWESWIARARKWTSGDGVMNEKDWTALLAASSLIGQSAQGRIDKTKALRAPTLTRAGVDPNEVFGESFKAFDFKTAGFDTPPGLMTAEQRLEKRLSDQAAAKKNENYATNYAAMTAKYGKEKADAMIQAAREKTNVAATKSSQMEKRGK